jgi:hypothetical protein
VRRAAGANRRRIEIANWKLQIEQKFIPLCSSEIIMRILHTWWYLPSFLVGIFFVWSAISSAMPNEHVSLIIRLLSSGLFLIIALVCFWMSLAVGTYKKKARDMKRKMKEEIL